MLSGGEVQDHTFLGRNPSLYYTAYIGANKK